MWKFLAIHVYIAKANISNHFDESFRDLQVSALFRHELLLSDWKIKAGTGGKEEEEEEKVHIQRL